MQVERCILQITLCNMKLGAVETLVRARQPLLKILSRHRQRLMRRLRLRLRQIGIVALVERAAVATDVHEEVATFGQSGVQFLQSLDDEVDRPPQRLGHSGLAVTTYRKG